MVIGPGRPGGHDRFYGAAALSNTSVVVVGELDQPASTTAWVMTLDFTGKSTSQTYLGPGSTATDVVALASGELVVLAKSGSQVYLLHINATNTSQKNSVVLDADAADGRAVISTKDGGFAAAGHRTVGAQVQGRLWRVSSQLSALKVTSFAPPTTSFGQFHAVAQMSGGQFVAAGVMGAEEDDSSDAWVVRVGYKGDVEDKVCNVAVGGPKQDRFDRVLPLDDNGFIAVGRTASAGNGGTDGWVVRFGPACEVCGSAPLADSLTTSSGTRASWQALAWCSQDPRAPLTTMARRTPGWCAWICAVLHQRPGGRRVSSLGISPRSRQARGGMQGSQVRRG